MTRKRSTLLHAAGKYYDYQLLKLFQEVQNSSFPHWAKLVLLCSYILKRDQSLLNLCSFRKLWSHIFTISHIALVKVIPTCWKSMAKEKQHLSEADWNPVENYFTA